MREIETALVVEDNQPLRESICNLLEGSYNVIAAKDGEDGIQKAFSYSPDIIISDIMMPRKDGYQLLKVLKADARTSEIPIILLTALGSEEKELQGLNTGADDYIVKPFRARTLLARINNLISNRKRLKDILKENIDSSNIFENKEPVVSHLESLISDKFRFKNVPIPVLADKMKITSSKLERDIKKYTGMSPNKYIRSYKLNRAKYLIENSDMKVSDVAYMLGFNSLSYFGKCFKNKFGYTPSDGKK